MDSTDRSCNLEDKRFSTVSRGQPSSYWPFHLTISENIQENKMKILYCTIPMTATGKTLTTLQLLHVDGLAQDCSVMYRLYCITKTFLVLKIIPMTWRKTAVTPLLTHLNYCSVALSHQCVMYRFNCIPKTFFRAEDNIDGLAQDCSNSIANSHELLQSCA